MASNNLEYTLRLKDLFSKTMRGALEETKKLDDSMNSMKRMASGLFAGIGLVGLGREILNVGVGFDNIKAGLTTLTGSAEKANAVFNQIKKDAATTPFGVEALASANQQLIGSGENALAARNNILNLGNAIAATGGTEDTFNRMASNLSQIKALGKATGADIKQFGFAGINIYGLLSKSLGINKDKVKDLDITYEQLTKAFDLAAKKGGMFYRGLENGNKTLGGQISNLKDNFRAFLYSIYEGAKPALTFIVNQLNNLITLIKTLAPLIKIGVTLWASYIVNLKLGAISSYQFAVANRAMAMGMSKSAIATTYLSRGIKGIGMAIKSVPIIGWVLALVEGVTYLWDTFSGFRESIYAFIDSIKSMGTSLSYMFQGVWNLMKGNTKLGVQQLKNAALNQLNASAQGTLRGKKEFAEKNKLGASFDLASIGGDSSSGGVGGGSGKGSKSLGTGTEVTGQRPQSLTINITKLVESLNVQTTNLTEGTAKIKEMVSKALLEAVNDANLTAMA